MGDTRHRKRRRKSGTGVVTILILVLALGVFCFSAYQLYKIFGGYYRGQKEYDKVRDLAVENDKDTDSEDGEPDGFRVNFDELMKINPDTVGWLRFDPEPHEINYPLVQTDNNSTYLNKTFSANENTVGAIFVNYMNHSDFNDKNTIIYGHHMKDNSMFHQLEKYLDEEFWRENQYFYIYTPDGKEITYHIYSSGIVEDTSDSYLTVFNTVEEFQGFLDTTVAAGAYSTGVEVDTDDMVVTLSTCTKESNENRMVVRGVRESERMVGEPAGAQNEESTQ